VKLLISRSTPGDWDLASSTTSQILVRWRSPQHPSGNFSEESNWRAVFLTSASWT